MTIQSKVNERLNNWQDDNILSVAKYLILDDQTYFLLKEEVYESTELAIELELELYQGLKVVYNRFGHTLIDVAG